MHYVSSYIGVYVRLKVLKDLYDNNMVDRNDLY